MLYFYQVILKQIYIGEDNHWNRSVKQLCMRDVLGKEWMHRVGVPGEGELEVLFSAMMRIVWLREQGVRYK